MELLQKNYTSLFTLTESQKWNEDTMSSTVVYDIKSKFLVDGTPITKPYQDISACKDKVITLLDRLKRNSVSALHIQDIIEDYVQELSMDL